MVVDFNLRIHNSEQFSEAANFFKKNKCYTFAPKGTTDYVQYWERETDRCLNGYTSPDGLYITGYHYFYLNYSPIMKIVLTKYTDKDGNIRTKRERILDFPRFWDYDWYYFNAIEQAEIEGKHMAVLKSRQRGYSFKGASMLVRNYELIKGSKNFAVASEQKFLIGDGLLTKAWEIMDFIDANTEWAKQRLTSTRMERVSGYKITDEYGKLTEQGYKSSICGITLKNDPERIRGTRGKLVLWEEGGKFPNLLDAWRIELPSVENDDGVAFGTMIAFGCVCKGTKVWTSAGDCVNIEDIKKEQGILGWDTYQAVQQHIDNINPPALKPCVRITTNTGRTLECSTDHPLLWSTPGKTKRVPGKRKENEVMKAWLFHDAGKCKVGEQVGVIDSIPFFGTKKMWEPRVVGWLIGDGSYGFDKTPRLANCDFEINDYIETHFDTVPDKPARKTKDGKIYKETRIKGICKNLRELGIYGQTKKLKRLPINIHLYDAESLSELIGGLFDTDGYISIDKTGRPRITLTLCLEEILREIELVLLHFGIHCSINFIKTNYRLHEYNGKIIKDGSGHWRLTVQDINSVGNFSKYITCYVLYKQSALDLMHLYTQNWISKYHKYVLGVHAEKIIKIEDIGMLDIYNLTAKEQHNYICNGIVTHNTGGTEGASFDGLKELFYKPKAYNVLSFPNIWDEGRENTECGFFVPSWSNLESFDDNGNYVYMDNDGNSLKEKAIGNLIELRNKIKDGGASLQSIDRFISERPITPQEAVLELGKNIFPRKLLMDLLTRIRTNVKLLNMKHIVDLAWDGNGQVKATEKKSGDITSYPLKKGDKPHGSVVIWEYPVNDPPLGLYIAGCLMPGEKVITLRGLVNVLDVTLNDKLLNKENKFVEIKNLQRYNKVNEPIFEIKPYGSFRTTKFTGEHPIWINKCGFVKAKEVSKGLWLEIPNRFATYKMGTLDDTALKLYYFYGLWVGDGFCTKNSNSYDIYMSIGKDEKELAEFYDKIVYELFDRKCIHIHKQTELSRRFTSKDLFLKLKSMFGNSAYNKRIPDEIKLLPYNYKRAFLLGYLDSDGSVFNTARGIRTNFTSVNLLLLEDILDMLFGMQIANSIVIHLKECTNKQGIHSLLSYRINISKSDQKELYYNAVFNSRKILLLKNALGYTKSKMPIKFIDDKILIKVENIKQSSYTGIVYNFECDTHTFMCRNILTHNCDPLNISGV